MQINYNHAENNNRVWRHEFGHTLGLLHEHQRHDRDDYVTAPSGDTANYGKVPKQTAVAGLEPVRILFITVYVPYVWYVDYGKTVGGFDFDSIMLYSSQSNIYRKKAINGSISIPLNQKLSGTDIAAVKQMY
jgi:hypothetical protein